MNYIIKNDTLYLKINNESIYVMEINNEMILNENIIKVLNNSCIYYGSSLKGRILGAKSLIKSKYKLPLIISEKNNLFFINIKDKNGYEYWLNFQYIKDYIYVDNLLKIFFEYDKSLLINCSWTIFNNQMLKCSRLYVVYSMR